MAKLPLANGVNGGGRDAQGRFTRGNPGGPGNPRNREVADLRAELLSTVTPRRLKRIVNALVEKAEQGDVVAAREVLDRVLGKPKQAVDLDASVSTDYGSEKRLDQMSDVELAHVIREGGLEVPPILAKKVKLIEKRETEHAADQAPFKPEAKESGTKKPARKGRKEKR